MPPKKKTAPAKTASTKKATPAHSVVSHAKPTPIAEPKTNLRPFPAPAAAATALSVLKHIVESTRVEPGFTFAPTDALEMLHPDAIQVNKQLTNEFGHMAVRATAAGEKLLAEMLQPASQPETVQSPFAGAAFAAQADPTWLQRAAEHHAIQADIVAGQPKSAVGAVSGIAIETDVPLPANIDTASRSRYPFDSLQIGHSFFIANTPEVPSQRKRLASTVANANKKYREAGIRFVVRDGIHASLGAGARVHRVS